MACARRNVVIGDLAAFDLKSSDADTRDAAVGFAGLGLLLGAELPVRFAALIHLQMDVRILEQHFGDLEPAGKERHQLGADDDRFDVHHLRMTCARRVRDRNIAKGNPDLRIDREPHGPADMNFAPERGTRGALDRRAIHIEGNQERIQPKGAARAPTTLAMMIWRLFISYSLLGRAWGRRARRDEPLVARKCGETVGSGVQQISPRSQ